jgi:hypothetical protein
MAKAAKPKKPNRRRTDKAQSERFRRAAKELGADEGGEDKLESVFTELYRQPRRKDKPD